MIDSRRSTEIGSRRSRGYASCICGNRHSWLAAIDSKLSDGSFVDLRAMLRLCAKMSTFLTACKAAKVHAGRQWMHF